MIRVIHFLVLLTGVGVMLSLVIKGIVWLLGLVGHFLFGALFVISVYKIANFLLKSSTGFGIVSYRR